MHSEFGSLAVSRFGGGTLINSAIAFDMASWAPPSGYDYPTNFNDPYYLTTNLGLQWFLGGVGSSGYEKDIPSDATRVLVAWGGLGGYACTMSILSYYGAELFRATHQTYGTNVATDARIDDVPVDFSTGPGKVRFQEDGANICWTF